MYIDLLQINVNEKHSENLTKYINVNEYAINQHDIFETWTDGNFILHRDITRQRISGSFQIGFTSAIKFNWFCELLEKAKQDEGYYNLKVYVNNLDDNVTISAYMDFDVTRIRDILNNRSWNVFTINIEER